MKRGMIISLTLSALLVFAGCTTSSQNDATETRGTAREEKTEVSEQTTAPTVEQIAESAVDVQEQVETEPEAEVEPIVEQEQEQEPVYVADEPEQEEVIQESDTPQTVQKENPTQTNIENAQDNVSSSSSTPDNSVVVSNDSSSNGTMSLGDSGSSGLSDIEKEAAALEQAAINEMLNWHSEGSRVTDEAIIAGGGYIDEDGTQVDGTKLLSDN